MFSCEFVGDILPLKNITCCSKCGFVLWADSAAELSH